MSTSKPVAALTAILIAGAASLAVAGPPTPADTGRQSGASREGGARVKPVHLPTGQQPGNQPAPQQSAPSPATTAIPRTPHYQNSERHSAEGAASNSGTRRQDAGDDAADNKLDNFSLQQATSQQAEAEQLERNAAKKTEDRVPKRTSDAIFGPSAPRGPTPSANGAARSSTIGASSIVPPEDPEN